MKIYQPSYQKELVHKQSMLDLIHECEDCFLRSFRLGHFVASAFLLNVKKTHVLSMHHAKLDKWMQLGSHCDGESDALSIAMKEAQEESGMNKIIPLNSQIFDIDMHLIPANAKDAAHCHFDIRFLSHAHEDDKFHKKFTKEIIP